MDDLAGKAVLITGGGSGIGRATALAFAEHGAKIVISDVNTRGGEETLRLLAGAEAVFLPADVTQAGEVAALVSQAVAAYGRLDFAVNSAGVAGNYGARTSEIAEDDWDFIVNVNLKGVWLCMKHEIAQMEAQGGGVIVNLASAAGLIGTPKGAAYAASKHGVIGLTKSAALEYARRNIRVNAVCPAFVDTPMVAGVVEQAPQMAELTVKGNPMRRLGRPEEVSGAVVWLCSAQASFITGHALAVDGGLTAM